MGPTYRHGTGQNSTSTSNRTRRVIPMLDWSCNTITNACFCSLDEWTDRGMSQVNGWTDTRTDLQSEPQTSSSSSQCQRSVFISTRAGSVSPAQHYLLMRLLMLLLLFFVLLNCISLNGREEEEGWKTVHCRCNT